MRKKVLFRSWSMNIGAKRGKLFCGLCLIPFRDKIKEKLIKSLSVQYYEFLSGTRKSKFRIIELFWICFDAEADEKFIAGGICILISISL